MDERGARIAYAAPSILDEMGKWKGDCHCGEIFDWPLGASALSIPHVDRHRPPLASPRLLIQRHST